MKQTIGSGSAVNKKENQGIHFHARATVSSCFVILPVVIDGAIFVSLELAGLHQQHLLMNNLIVSD